MSEEIGAYIAWRDERILNPDHSPEAFLAEMQQKAMLEKVEEILASGKEDQLTQIKEAMNA